MCGRYSLVVDLKYFAEHYGYTVERFDFSPNYNISPGSQVPIIYADRSGEPAVTAMRWGLVPRWAKDKSPGYRLINARSETVDVKPAFRHAFAGGRCLVPADGFYEWEKDGERKIPYRVVFPDSRPFVFAGLWDLWDPGAAGEILYSFAILTAAANEDIKPVHPRMPVILDPDDWGRWLNPDSGGKELKDLLLPYPGKLLVYEVSSLVNSPRNNSPEVIRPVHSHLQQPRP